MWTDAVRMAPIRFFADAGAVKFLPDHIADTKVFIVAGSTAWEKAGEVISKLLTDAGCTLKVRQVGRECHSDLIAELA